jgi:gamma-glutamyltranspeptidase / glutathione hydrolase
MSISVENKSVNASSQIITRKTLPEKPIVHSTQYMVSTPHELASKAAKAIIEKGGSAADAAIASQLVLTITTPEATGIGGGGFINVYDKKNKKPIIYDARETAPANVKEDEFTDENGKTAKYTDAIAGGRAVATPGLLKGLKEVHDNHGRLEWKELFAPAIEIAEKGFPMPKRLHMILSKATHYTRLSDNAKRYYRTDGTLKPVGEIITNPELAKTFKEIANKGIDAFYTGEIAQDIIDTVTKSSIHPGKMTLEDLKNYKPIKREAAEIDYKNFLVYAPPSPSSGGIAVLQALKLLEPFEIQKYDANDVKIESLINNALRLVYRDRNEYIGDPDFVKIDTKKLLSDAYLKPRQVLLSKSDKALRPEDKPQDIGSPSGNTSHSSIIDKEGNAVSITSSVECALGSGLETKSGFILNSTMNDFTLDGYKTNSPNKIEPNKRPRSAMCPVIVQDKASNDVKLLIGTPGGGCIIAYLARRMLDILDHKIPIHKAAARPNYVPMTNDTKVEYEKDLLTDTEKNYLTDKNFDLVPSKFISGFQIVENDSGFLSGTSDPRRDGVAIGGDK